MTANEIKKHKIRILVRQMYRDQKDRIRLGNSLQLKKDGSLQKANNVNPEEYIHDIPELVDRYQDLVERLCKPIRLSVATGSPKDTLPRSIRTCVPR